MRLLLSVGCDAYQQTSELQGAAKDASAIFSALVGNEEHQYSPTHSKLLLSPTGEQLRQSLSSILYDTGEIAVFTMYFAGHAVVVDETLYIAPVDVVPDRIPASAIGFPEILRSTAGARPRQANFVLDACNTGGLGFDIGAILKRTIVGNSDTMGISFVASAAAEEAAVETLEGGRFTVEFARVLRGEVFVQQANPFLSLAEIAQQIHLDSQTMSYWSLNLQGPNLFARNPNFSGPAYVVDAIAAQFKNQKIEVGKHAAEFKSEIAKIGTGIDERTLAKRLENVLSEIELEHRAPLIHGLAAGLRLELATSQDCFLEARVHSVLLGQLLGLCPAKSRDLVCHDMIAWHLEANIRAIGELSEALDRDRNALLETGFSDLYELPIRISDILGYCALVIIGDRANSERIRDLVSTVIGKILDRYGNSVLALTDDQATGYLLALETCRSRQWITYAEEITGRLYNDLHQNFARCGDYSLDAESQFALLRERYQYSYSINRDVYRFPSDLCTVILSFCAILRLDEAVDFSLIDIDHTPINYFVCENPERLGLLGDLKGANYTLSLGRDFWRCIDLRSLLREDILRMFHSTTTSLSWEDRFCAAAGSLALRDRQPWHVIDPSF